MTIRDIGKGLKDSLHGAADAVKGKVKDVEMPDFKRAGEQASEQVKNLLKKTGTAKAAEESGAAGENGIPKAEGISTQNAIKIIYFLMAADGEIQPAEEEKFEAMGAELDPGFFSFKEQLIKECRESLDKAIDPEDYYDALCDGVEDALLFSKRTVDAFISPKLLLWDLITIAYSDQTYHESERKLLKHIVRKLDIDKAVFLEMESSVLTVMDIHKELEWVKTTDRPYLTIEAMVTELSGRQAAVFESVKDLITL